MSIKYKKALRRGKVTIQGRVHGEVAVIYYDHQNRRRQRQIRGRKAIMEVIPKLSPIGYADRSNIEELVNKGLIRIID